MIFAVIKSLKFFQAFLVRKKMIKLLYSKSKSRIIEAEDSILNDQVIYKR